MVGRAGDGGRRRAMAMARDHPFVKNVQTNIILGHNSILFINENHVRGCWVHVPGQRPATTITSQPRSGLALNVSHGRLASRQPTNTEFYWDRSRNIWQRAHFAGPQLSKARTPPSGRTATTAALLRQQLTL